MKQIIYNIQTQQLSRVYSNGYKIDGKHDYTAKELAEQAINNINWQGLRTELNQSAFYPLALSHGNNKIFSVIMTALAQGGRWVNDLNFAMSNMAQELFTSGNLSAADVTALNTILANNNIPFQITVS